MKKDSFMEQNLGIVLPVIGPQFIKDNPGTPAKWAAELKRQPTTVRPEIEEDVFMAQKDLNPATF
jgi:hypothetical protein